jgi:hypothetical protein
MIIPLLAKRVFLCLLVKQQFNTEFSIKKIINKLVLFDQQADQCDLPVVS